MALMRVQDRALLTATEFTLIKECVVTDQGTHSCTIERSDRTSEKILG